MSLNDNSECPNTDVDFCFLWGVKLENWSNISALYWHAYLDL